MCTGFTQFSEGSPENAFLLVENYNMTTPAWIRPGREFLEPFLFFVGIVFRCHRRLVAFEMRKVRCFDRATADALSQNSVLMFCTTSST